MKSAGIEIREAHFPGRAPIDAYGNGGFRFAEMSHRGSLMCLPSGIYGWNAAEPADLTDTAFEALFAEADDIEVCLIGSGLDLVPIRKALRERFSSAFIQADSMSTGAAVRTYNVLLAENRAVAAALLAV
ncbi:MAG: Mth938-like domain-containing protein [Nitratireductor sp.]|nr:Mth938-like domain-containing protein [Nitratireductor sp.]